MNFIKLILVVSIFCLLVFFQPVQLKKYNNERETVSVKDETPQPESCQVNDCKNGQEKLPVKEETVTGKKNLKGPKAKEVIVEDISIETEAQHDELLDQVVGGMEETLNMAKETKKNKKNKSEKVKNVKKREINAENEINNNDKEMVEVKTDTEKKDTSKVTGIKEQEQANKQKNKEESKINKFKTNNKKKGKKNKKKNGKKRKNNKRN